MKKIICLLNLNQKFFEGISPRRFYFLDILSCSRDIHLLKHADNKSLFVMSFTHAFKMRFAKQRISLKTSGKIHPIFPRLCSYTILLYSCKV